ncbi:hypothetical protein [Micromonospora rifamycinica]|uniref:hypothetical protein n=1 Tax=Micromonospora rifamycinica TaxID=291594 RepID=UPI00076CAE5E|nr:hypothetical protein [Micromonospora rifamycinica]KWV29636.1 hypothetical protein AWV63_27485 [Micromonospora rifamycinica]
MRTVNTTRGLHGDAVRDRHQAPGQQGGISVGRQAPFADSAPEPVTQARGIDGGGFSRFKRKSAMVRQKVWTAGLKQLNVFAITKVFQRGEPAAR